MSNLAADRATRRAGAKNGDFSGNPGEARGGELPALVATAHAAPCRGLSTGNVDRPVDNPGME
ncbi:MAG TPA: hypothetical protein VIZ64_00285, partial [Dokdonella sp.]